MILMMILLKNFSNYSRKIKLLRFTDSTKKKDKTRPKKPFITSTLQTSAQNELGYPVKMTMDLAQKLYENGHITYMRTDSTFISDEFQEKIKSHVGDTYYQKPNEKKVKGAQEAHEAIRPTKINSNPDVSFEELKLYNMIVKRTVAHLI